MDHGGDSEDHHNDSSPSWRRIIGDLVKAYGDGQRAKAHQMLTNDRAANWTAWATVVIAIFSAATAVVGIAQWEIQSGTLDEIRAEQRPWIELFGVVTEGMTVTTQGAEMRVQFQFKNVGHLPARGVSWHAEFGVKRNRTNSEIVAIQKAFCAEAIAADIRSHAPGVYAFPGTPSVGNMISWIPRTIVDEWRSNWATIQGTPIYLGCIDYQTPAGEHHQT